MMWRGTQIFFGVLNIAVIAMAAYFLLHGGVASVQNHQVVEYKDFVSILLTAIAVMIAILTIFVAAAAFWGFNSLKEEASKVAKEKASEVAKGVASEVARTEANQTAVRAVSSFLEQRSLREDSADMGAAAGGDNL